MKIKNTVITAVILIAAGAAGFGLQRYLQGSNDALPPVINADTKVIGQVRPDFELPDIDGHTRNVREFDGKVLMVNFWATWCPPCLKETPVFIELQNQYGEQGLQIIGMAVDDTQSVRDFVDTHGINYPVIAGELAAMEISRRYGNRLGALPYTAFIDRNGDIQHVTAGELSKDEAEKIIQSLL
jgi:peroxiredoxin